jgi:putative ATP-binding cassette transporter
MIKVLQFFFKSSWKQILIIAIVSTIAAGLNVLSIKFLKDLVTSEGSEMFYNISMIAILVISAGIITLFIERYSNRYFELKLASFREEISERLLLARFEKINKRLDRLAPVFMFEISEVSDFGKLIPAFIVAMVQIIAIMGYLIFLSWKLSVIVLSLFLIVIGLMSFVLPAVKRLKEKRSKTRYRLHTMFTLMGQGFKNLIMSSRHGKSFILNSIRPPSLETAKLDINIHMLKVVIEQIINVLFILGFGFSIILYLNWIQASQELAIQFMALLLFILPSFVRVIDFFNQIKNAENALDQINSIDADIRQNLIYPKEEVEYIPDVNKPIISLKDLTYSYNENEHGFKLGPLDIEIVENEITIINGGNGSGKTTVFNLIGGLYDPKGGEIYFQNKKITEDNIRSYRGLISSYFTDSPVFDDLQYVSPDSLKHGEKYIKDLELEGKTNISATTISEINLSYGQRGRLNLLRLLLEDRPIYMLDEWAANQDVHFKEKYYNEIIPDLKRRGKTVILISHDDRYYHIADKVITLRNGLLEKISNK